MSQTTSDENRKRADIYQGVSKRRVRIVAGKLINAIERAIDEVDLFVVTTSVKSKIIEYGLEAKPDKPTSEVIEEKEERQVVKGIVDRGGLKQITSILKELKDISVFAAELDIIEQEARIDSLISQVQRKSQGDDEGVTCGVVCMPLRELDEGGATIN